jgi:multiple sugar transport system substrate-binding protein
VKLSIKAALLAAVVFATGAHATETVVWWDFLGGGDGVRMKKLIEDFNTEHKDKIEIQATTLEWGPRSTARSRHPLPWVKAPTS